MAGVLDRWGLVCVPAKRGGLDLGRSHVRYLIANLRSGSVKNKFSSKMK